MATWSIDYKLCRTASSTKSHLHLRISWLDSHIYSCIFVFSHIFLHCASHPASTKSHLHLCISWLDFFVFSHFFLHCTESNTKSHLYVSIYAFTFTHFLLRLFIFSHLFMHLSASSSKSHSHSSKWIKASNNKSQFLHAMHHTTSNTKLITSVLKSQTLMNIEL